MADGMLENTGVNIQSILQYQYHFFMPLFGGTEEWVLAIFVGRIRVDILSFK